MQQLQQMIAIPATAPGANAVAQVTLNILQSRSVTPDLLAFDNGSFDFVSLVGTTLTVINKGSVAGTTNVWLYYFHSTDRSYGAASITALSPAPFIIRGAAGGGSAGLWGYPTSAALLAQPGPTAAQSQFAYVAEFDAVYMWSPGSVVAADTVRVIGHTGGVAGRWILDGEEVSFKPIGGLNDDWARAAVVMNAMAYYGDVHFINMGPLIPWRVDTKQTTPNGSNLWLHGSTFVSTLIPNAPGGAEDASPFYNSGGTEFGDTTTLAADVAAGDITITVASAAGLAIGDRLNLRGTNRRCAREIKNIVGVVVTLDRAVLRPYVIGDGVAVLPTCRDIQIHGQGALVTGTGDRIVEFISAWDCLVEDLHGDVTMDFFAFGYDVASRDSRFVRCTVDCNGTTPAGFAVENAENCAIDDCDSYRASTYNVLMLSTDSCTMKGGLHAEGLGIGLMMTVNDVTDTLGCRGSAIVGSSFIGNGTNGIQIQDGSSGNTFDGVTSSYNAQSGWFFTIGASASPAQRNLVSGGEARGNASAFHDASGGRGNRAEGLHTFDHTSGNVFVVSGATHIAVVDVEMYESVTAPGSTGWLYASAAGSRIDAVRVRGVANAAGGNAIFAEMQNGGEVVCRDSICELVAGNGLVFFTVFQIVGAGSNVDLADFTLSGATPVAGNTFGVNALVGAWARIGEDVDMPAGGGAFIGAGSFNRGQAALNGAVAVPLAFGGTRATDRCFTTLVAPGGVPTGQIFTGAPVAGTGFNVVGVAGDTSTFDYEIR